MTTYTVLCVDDDTTVLSSLRTLLAKMLGGDVTVDVAESGTEALELCTDLHAEGREVSIVISDFIMPGMRGDELLVRIHQMAPRTIKIMLTGQSDLEGIKRTINEANLYRFLEKPFNNADLVLTAKAALRAYKTEYQLNRKVADLEARAADLELRLAACTCGAAPDAMQVAQTQR